MVNDMSRTVTPNIRKVRPGCYALTFGGHDAEQILSYADLFALQKEVDFVLSRDYPEIVDAERQSKP